MRTTLLPLGLLFSVIGLNSCGKCDLTRDPSTEHFPDEAHFIWLPDSMPSPANFTAYNGFTDSWTLASAFGVQDSFYNYCSENKVVRAYYKRYTFFSVLNGEFEVEIRGGSNGTQLFLYLNGRGALYNFDVSASDAVGGFSSEFYLHDTYFAGGRLWNYVYEITLTPVSQPFDDNDPVKFFIARKQGLIRFEVNNGFVWERTN